MYKGHDRKTTTTTRMILTIARMSSRILLRVLFGDGGEGGSGGGIIGCVGRREDEYSYFYSMFDFGAGEGDEFRAIDTAQGLPFLRPNAVSSLGNLVCTFTGD